MCSMCGQEDGGDPPGLHHTVLRYLQFEVAGIFDQRRHLAQMQLRVVGAHTAHLDAPLPPPHWMRGTHRLDR